MSNIIDGIVKGLSGFMPQDDPDVKIFNAQSELKELAGKEEKVYARLGRQVYETDGGKSYPEIKTELDQLAANRQAAEERLKAAREEKIANGPRRKNVPVAKPKKSPTAARIAEPTTPKEPTSARIAVHASLHRHKLLPPNASVPIAEPK